MTTITGTLMSENREIARVEHGVITEYDEQLLPLYLKRTKDMEGWLASRAIDTHRTNSRLLKKALRIQTADDAQTALAVNAATVTDRYWFRPEGEKLDYEDIRFKENYFDTLALRGDPNGFSQNPSRTPELTNTGSFEKCWKLIDGVWWMYKSGNAQEHFSEMFIFLLGKALGMNMAYYEMDGDYIRTRNFTDGTNLNFEPISAVMGENENYNDCFEAIYQMSPEFAKQYLEMVWLDTLCYNMDRHTENFGLLRDVESGAIVAMAPNYDNNIALIARGYLRDTKRENDGLIRFFREFLEENEMARQMYREMVLPEVTVEMVEECLAQISIEVDRDYIKEFILNGQKVMRELIQGKRNNI